MIRNHPCVCALGARLETIRQEPPPLPPFPPPLPCLLLFCVRRTGPSDPVGLVCFTLSEFLKLPSNPERACTSLRYHVRSTAVYGTAWMLRYSHGCHARPRHRTGPDSHHTPRFVGLVQVFAGGGAAPRAAATGEDAETDALYGDVVSGCRRAGGRGFCWPGLRMTAMPSSAVA